MSPDNLLLHADNLPALRALAAAFAGRFHFAYLDPPYNAGTDRDHYADAGHGDWLGFLRDRLVALRPLMHPQGVVALHIDDAESAYAQVLLDEVFGRDRRVVTLYVRVRYAGKPLRQDGPFHKVVEQIHCVAAGPAPAVHAPPPDRDPAKFRWRVAELGDPRAVTLGGRRVDVFAAGAFAVTAGEPGPDGLKEVWASGAVLDGNTSGRFFRDHLHGRAEADGLGVLYKVHGLGDDGRGYRYFAGPRRPGATRGRYYQGVPLTERAGRGAWPNLLDLADAFGNCAHEGGVPFRGGKKPEALLEYLVERFSRPGQWVLDPFAGSGTTGAVAHRLGRRWVLVESGPQCQTHAAVRLRRAGAAWASSALSSSL